MSRYIAVIDQGTTSTHCMLFDRRGEVAATHRLEYQQILPQPGWVEHDPIELWHQTRQILSPFVASSCNFLMPCRALVPSTADASIGRHIVCL